jgi:hypothetical protein
VVGVTSFGYVGCYDYAPGVWTRVSSFNGWLDGVMAKSIKPEATAVNFGTLDVDSVTVDRTIKFSSIGEQAVNVSGVTATGDFKVKSNTCSGSIATDASCQITVTFDPSNTGARGGELLLSSDSPAGATTKVQLTGFGIGKSTVPVALKLTLPHPAKVKGKKVSAKFKVGYAFPAGSATPTACTGLVKLSMDVARLKKPVFKTASMGWTAKGCAVTIATSMPKKVKGKKAKATVTFAGNSIAGAATLKKTIKIR